jgi:hypothetical protein
MFPLYFGDKSVMRRESCPILDFHSKTQSYKRPIKGWIKEMLVLVIELICVAPPMPRTRLALASNSKNFIIVPALEPVIRNKLFTSLGFDD